MDPTTLDEESSELWAQGVKEFLEKGGFSSIKGPDRKSIFALSLTTLGDVFRYEEPRYLIDPLLIEGSVNLLSGPGGKGKSLVSLSIAKSILTGKALWGKYPVKVKGPVLIVDEETPKSFLRDRVERMGFNNDLPLWFLHFQDLRLDNEVMFKELLSCMIYVSPVFVIFDSLIRLHR